MIPVYVQIHDAMPGALLSGNGTNKSAPVQSYLDTLLGELDEIEREFVEVLQRSEIRYVNPNHPGSRVVVVAAADFGWAPSEPDLEARRMALLRRVREWVPRFKLLFPHPTPEVQKRHNHATKLLERWLVRSEHFDYSIPGTVPEAVEALKKHVQTLRAAHELLPQDKFPMRLIVDTNTLIDEPDLSVFVNQLGARYMVHLLPVVLGELDNLKRSGRTEQLRDAARRADRRLKGLRNNGDVLQGVKVAGDVWARFEHIEPRNDEQLPSWLDFSVPDDRVIAASMLLQSDHPGSTFTIATGDLNLQTKLAAVGLPYVELAP